MLLEENKAIVRSVFEEAWNQGNLSAANTFLDEAYVGHINKFPELRDIDGFKQFVSLYRNAFPDVHFTIED